VILCQPPECHVLFEWTLSTFLLQFHHFFHNLNHRTRGIVIKVKNSKANVFFFFFFWFFFFFFFGGGTVGPYPNFCAMIHFEWNGTFEVLLCHIVCFLMPRNSKNIHCVPYLGLKRRNLINTLICHENTILIILIKTVSNLGKSKRHIWGKKWIFFCLLMCI